MRGIPSRAYQLQPMAREAAVNPKHYATWERSGNPHAACNSFHNFSLRIGKACQREFGHSFVGRQIRSYGLLGRPARSAEFAHFRWVNLGLTMV